VKTQEHKTSTPTKAKVLVIDDHPIIRMGLMELIDREPDMISCGQASDAAEALEAIEHLQPDVAIVDLKLKDSSGLELIKDIRVRFPTLLMLVLSMSDESLYAERVLHAGARGYVMKEIAADDVIDAIRRVLAGEVYLSKRMSAKLLSKMVGGRNVPASPLETLSDRELQVFELIGQGQGTRNIAETLCLSIKTIETYRAHIKEKLHLANAAELVQRAVQWVQSK